ncbi:MAG TPA: pyridoxal-dependent decarboxylase, partial [Candidatus Sulfomarinibacteraceae bacterium]|nr:pyridoxal-dependent decarboxylase [Candidatus Sulfomarinibacteraceae bacterium]
MRDELDPQQVDGLTDLDPEAFRAALHAVADLMADYAARVEAYPVLPPIEPGSLAELFPSEPPEDPSPLAAILDDYRTLIEPNATHWSHPGFMALFATPASAAGVLGEMLMASLSQNTMLWRTSPIGTELESVVVGWLRQGLGLPDAFDGFITDTASTSSLISLAGARDAAGFAAATDGLRGRVALGRPMVYASAEAHSSIEKACMTLGLGRAGLTRIETDAEYRMRPDALAAAIEEDLAAGRRPVAIVATIGTTSSTSVDPVAAIADVAAAHGLWLHVDAAYGGAVALLPDRRAVFAGWERADSIVVNPHKWLFSPLDASLLLTRRMPALRDAFSLVPEYLRTLDRERPVRDVHEYTPVL